MTNPPVTRTEPDARALEVLSERGIQIMGGLMAWRGDVFTGYAIPAAMEQYAAEKVERAWQAGWADCKSCLTNDEAFCLTDDVEHEAWLDSDTRAAIRGADA